MNEIKTLLATHSANNPSVRGRKRSKNFNFSPSCPRVCRKFRNPDELLQYNPERLIKNKMFWEKVNEKSQSVQIVLYWAIKTVSTPIAIAELLVGKSFFSQTLKSFSFFCSELPRIKNDN